MLTVETAIASPFSHSGQFPAAWLCGSRHFFQLPSRCCAVKEGVMRTTMTAIVLYFMIVNPVRPACLSVDMPTR